MLIDDCCWLAIGIGWLTFITGAIREKEILIAFKAVRIKEVTFEAIIDQAHLEYNKRLLNDLITCNQTGNWGYTLDIGGCCIFAILAYENIAWRFGKIPIFIVELWSTFLERVGHHFGGLRISIGKIFAILC